MKHLFIVLWLCSIFNTIAQSAPDVAKTSSREAQAWMRWVIPLPKEARIPRKVNLSAASVKVTLAGKLSPLRKNALRNLRSLFIDKAGVDPVAGEGFEVLLGLCDQSGRIGGITVPDADRLRKLPNREQAYLIRPIGTTMLVIAAIVELERVRAG